MQKPGPQAYPNRTVCNVNYRAMIHWMCGVTTTKDQVSSQNLLEKMQLEDLAKVLHTRQLR